MIHRLKPYPAYKDSGVEWLGTVPEHWEVRRLGSLLQERRETNEGFRVTNVLSVLRERGVIPYAEKGNIGNKKSDDISRYKIVRPNDIVMNSMNVIIGSVGLSKFTGCISPVYYILTRREVQDDPRYLNAYFQTKPFQKSLIRLGNGILAHRMRIPMELLKSEPFPRPPAEEQAAIVRFLDYMDRRIRRVIRARQKRIKLLEEYKQALIHQAVTGRIDARTGQPYPVYKPSGVKWLGQVPAHWEVRRLKQLGEVKIGLTYAPGDVTGNEGILVLRASNIRDGAIVSADDVFVSKKVPKSLRVTEGDILICVRSGSANLVGKAAIIPPGFSGVTFGAFMSLLRSRFNPFIYWVFNSHMLPSVMAQFQTSTINQLTQNDLRNLDIPLPPLPEQTAIAEYLDAQTAKIDAAISASRREIDLLREYRTRLISDVVTGKVDVREVAAQLPEEPPEEEAELMDTEEIAESETANDDAAAEALPEEEVEP